MCLNKLEEHWPPCVVVLALNVIKNKTNKE